MQAAVSPAPPGPAPDRARFVCACLRVTERALLSTLSRPDVRTLCDLRRVIGAGDGCTACHPELQRYLDARGQQPVVKAPRRTETGVAPV